MRQRFAQAGISQPSVLARFGSLSEVDKHPWEQVRFPVIAKPVDLTSSLYVRCVDNPQEARSMYRRIFKHVQSFGGASFSGAGLLEEYVPGPEYSAECIVDEGLLVALFVTTKFVSPLPACDEIGHLCGAPVPARHRLAIEDTAHRVIAAWQIKGGVLHIEYKYVQEKVIVMEAACRIGGDFISELVELQHGVNLEEHLLRIRSRSPCLLAEAPSARDEERFGIRFMFARSRDWHPENGISVLREIRYSREAPPHREFGIHERNRFKISDTAGEPAHTGCVGFGLERWVLALFTQAARVGWRSCRPSDAGRLGGAALPPSRGWREAPAGVVHFPKELPQELM